MFLFNIEVKGEEEIGFQDISYLSVVIVAFEKFYLSKSRKKNYYILRTIFFSRFAINSIYSN